MDKNNKYYDIIENLVKNHKKFKGLEAILDDIMDDVYSHSEIIISSIKDENVIKSYLEKIVSTSLITVPKKLNFNRDVHHAVIGSDYEQKYNDLMQTVSSEKTDNNDVIYQQEDDKKQELKVNTEYVDKMINLAEPSLKNSEEAELENTDSDEISPEFQEDDEENIETVDLELDKEANADFENMSFNDNITDEKTDTDELVFDFDAFDEDENEKVDDEEKEEEDNTEEPVLTNEITDGISNEFETEQLDAISEEDKNDIISGYEEIDVRQEEELEEQDDIYELSSGDKLLPEEDEVYELDSTSEIPAEENNIYNLDSTSDLFPEENKTIEFPEPEENILKEDCELDSYEETENNELISEEPDSDEFNIIDSDGISSNDGLLMLDNNDEEFSIEPDITEHLSLEENNQTVEDLAEIPEYNANQEIEEPVADFSNSENNLSSNSSDFIPSDFSCLYYEPKDILKNVDSDEIISQIYNLNDSSPELNVLAVYNLKYKQNMPISKIAEELSLDESSVIEALNKIIDLV